MNIRIAEVRKAVNLTQEKFAAQLGLSRNFLWMIEKGDRVPSDRTIADICREFNVNEEWLRTGKGEMFNPHNEKLAAFIGSLVADDGDPFKRRMVSLLADLTPEEWKLLERMAERLTKKEEGGA